MLFSAKERRGADESAGLEHVLMKLMGEKETSWIERRKALIRFYSLSFATSDPAFIDSLVSARGVRRSIGQSDGIR